MAKQQSPSSSEPTPPKWGRPPALTSEFQELTRLPSPHSPAPVATINARDSVVQGRDQILRPAHAPPQFAVAPMAPAFGPAVAGPPILPHAPAAAPRLAPVGTTTVQAPDAPVRQILHATATILRPRAAASTLEASATATRRAARAMTTATPANAAAWRTPPSQQVTNARTNPNATMAIA